MVARLPALLLKTSASILGIVAVVAPVTAPAQDITVLTGTSVNCSSASSEGQPETIEWFVTEPAAQPPTVPTSTAASFNLIVDRSGTWQVRLVATYAHQSGGSAWQSSASRLILARSVVANLTAGSTQYTTSDTIDLDGTGSQISSAATARFLVDGTEISDCVFAAVTDPASLVCNVPAADLGEGDFIFTLELANGGEIDTDTVAVTVANPPPFSIDFTWFPVNPDPTQTTQLNLVVPTGYTHADLTEMRWWWDDGSAWETLSCPVPFLGDCDVWSHQFSSENFYDVILEVTTTDQQIASISHEIQVGNPPRPPVAAGEALPNPATLRQSILFSFTGTCEDVCTYTWNFGDGVASGSRDAGHFYTSPGSKTVSVEATNSQGTDSATFEVPVTSCWSPLEAISQSGSCYGRAVALTSPAGTAWVWNTGQTSQQILVTQPGLLWVDLEESNNACWAYLEHTAIFDACTGTPHGNVTMDPTGLVDAADISILVRELVDGDGDLVIDMGAGDIGAPGADLAGTTGPEADGRVTIEDHAELVSTLFAG